MRLFKQECLTLAESLTALPCLNNSNENGYEKYME